MGQNAQQFPRLPWTTSLGLIFSPSLAHIWIRRKFNLQLHGCNVILLTWTVSQLCTSEGLLHLMLDAGSNPARNMEVLILSTAFISECLREVEGQTNRNSTLGGKVGSLNFLFVAPFLKYALWPRPHGLGFQGTGWLSFQGSSNSRNLPKQLRLVLWYSSSGASRHDES